MKRSTLLIFSRLRDGGVEMVMTSSCVYVIRLRDVKTLKEKQDRELVEKQRKVDDVTNQNQKIQQQMMKLEQNSKLVSDVISR